MARATKDQWANAYEAAFNILDMFPWAYMGRYDVFGVQISDWDEPGWVNAATSLEEESEFRLNMFMGAKGLAMFYESAWADAKSDIQIADPLRECDYWSVVFITPDMLSSIERKRLKDLGYKAADKPLLPRFEFSKEGHAPRKVEQSREVAALGRALQVAEYVFARCRINPRFLEHPLIPAKNIQYVPVFKAAGSSEPRPMWEKLNEAGTLMVPVPQLDDEEAKELLESTKPAGMWQVVLYYSTRGDEKPGTPYPRVLICMIPDKLDSPIIIEGRPGEDAGIVLEFLSAMKDRGTRPETIMVMRSYERLLLEDIAEQLGIELAILDRENADKAVELMLTMLISLEDTNEDND